MWGQRFLPLPSLQVRLRSLLVDFYPLIHGKGAVGREATKHEVQVHPLGQAW